MSNPIYSTSNDHDVKAVVLYGDGDDSLLHTEEVYSDDTIVAMDRVVDLFLRNMLIVKDDGVYYRPAKLEIRDHDDGTVGAYIRCEDNLYMSQTQPKGE